MIIHPLVLWLGPQAHLLWLVLLPGVTLVEGLRLRGRLPVLERFFGALMRPEEKKRPSGAFYYLWGVGLAFCLFPQSAALTGLWVLAVADGLAGLFGRDILHSVVFGVLSLGVVLLRGYPFSGELLAILLLWTLVERMPYLNDNFTLPLVVAWTLS